MRVSDDRYSRDRLRFDLAVRMIRHEARTCTIRVWTGLTDDRIRKLYRGYMLHAPATPVRRHRGKSPRQASFFLRTPAVHFEATTLASIFCMLGLVPPLGSAPLRALPPVSLEWGEFFCQAYESHLALHATPRVTFEHAWFLLLALLRQDELTLRACSACGRLCLVDAYAPAGSTCSRCGRLPGNTRPGHRADAAGVVPVHRDWSPARPEFR
jgi:hypothetical protein